jgi:hypothetical protein
MIFSRKRPIILECFTDRKDVYELSKIDYAYRFFPDYIKSMKEVHVRNSIFEVSTLKNCVGLHMLYHHGFILPLWSDLFIQVKDAGHKWHFADGVSQAESHDPEQFKELSKDMYNLKLVSPWRIKTNSDINWVLNMPMWSHLYATQHKILPAVVNFKEQHNTNINMLIHWQPCNEFYIHHKTPMLHFVPLSDRPIKFKYHLVDKLKYDTLKTPRLKFINNFPYIKKLKNENNTNPTKS